MDQNAGQRCDGEAEELHGRRHERELVQRVTDDGERGGSVDERTEIHFSQREEEARVDRQQQHEVESPGADEFGHLHAIGQEEGLENLLDEMRHAEQQHHFPLRPVADVIGVRIDDDDERELQREPKHLNHDPEQEVRLEAHLANDRVPPERDVDGPVAADWGRQKGECRMQKSCGLGRFGFYFCLLHSAFCLLAHPPTAAYFRIPRAHMKRANRYAATTQKN